MTDTSTSRLPDDTRPAGHPAEVGRAQGRPVGPMAPSSSQICSAPLSGPVARAPSPSRQWNYWEWGDAPLGASAFGIRSVALNSSGTVWVGGWSNGIFDGEEIGSQYGQGGWVTEFFGPVPSTPVP